MSNESRSRVIPWFPTLFNVFGAPMAASAPACPLVPPSDVKPSDCGLSVRFLRQWDIAPYEGKGSVVQVRPQGRYQPRDEGDEPRISAEAADYLRQWYER